MARSKMEFLQLDENRSLHLFLDDIRHPEEVRWIQLPNVKWTVVQGYEQFVETVLEQGIPATVSFDHDLTEEHCEAYSNERRKHVAG